MPMPPRPVLERIALLLAVAVAVVQVLVAAAG